jgi:hypothetical protein
MSSHKGPRARNAASLHPSVFDTLDNPERHLEIDCNFSRFLPKSESLVNYTRLEVIRVMSAERYFAFFAWHGDGDLQQRNISMNCSSAIITIFT